MRTTVTLDDELLAKARKYTGIEEEAALVNAGSRRCWNVRRRDEPQPLEA